VKGFLFDENLPRRIRFQPSLPVTHVTSLGSEVPDEMIWNHAREQQLVIVTKDADFSEKIQLLDPPPWVVHVRVGNLCRTDLHLYLQRVWPRVEQLLPSSKLIELYSDRIERFALEAP
jgi:predicted nuclease of predicted toxin-antitoxin system